MGVFILKDTRTVLQGHSAGQVVKLEKEQWSSGEQEEKWKEVEDPGPGEGGQTSSIERGGQWGEARLHRAPK